MCSYLHNDKDCFPAEYPPLLCFPQMGSSSIDPISLMTIQACAMPLVISRVVPNSQYQGWITVGESSSKCFLYARNTSSFKQCLTVQNTLFSR